MSLFDTAYPDRTSALASGGPCVLTEMPDHCPVASMRLYKHTSVTVGDLGLLAVGLAVVLVAAGAVLGCRRLLRRLRLDALRLTE